MAFYSLAPPNGEQRYLILEYKVRIFEDVIHEDDEFAHDGGQGDFGGFASGPEPLIELFELMIRAGRDQGGHVERAADGRASPADTAAAMPLTAFAWMGSQSCQGGGLAAVEGAQFRQFGEHAQGGDRPDAGDGFELL